MEAAGGADLSLVAVIRIDQNRPVSDLDRFVALALPSFHRFLAPGLVSELVVVVPPTDVDETVRRLEATSSLPFRVLSEADVSPRLADVQPGWAKQQLIKLGLPAVVRTPWFITLDADVVAARPLDRDFLFPAGQALWQQEAAGAHLDWWQKSAAVLHSTTVVTPDQPVFGVTPALMHTASVREMTQRLEEIHPKQSWVDALVTTAGPGWTEYTLYWTHLLDTGAANVLYSPAARYPYSLDGSVWVADQILTRGTAGQLPTAFALDSSHAFFVFQSNLERPLRETVALLRPFVDNDQRVTTTERLQWARHRWRFQARRVVRGLRARVRQVFSRRG